MPASQDQRVPDPRFCSRIREGKWRSLSLLRFSFCAWQRCGRAAGPCSPHQPPWALSWGEAGHDLPLGVNIASSRRMDFRGKGPSCLLCVKAGRRLKDKTALTSAYLPCLLLPAPPRSCRLCLAPALHLFIQIAQLLDLIWLTSH